MDNLSYSSYKNYHVTPVQFHSNTLKEVEPEIYEEFLDLYKLVLPMTENVTKNEIAEKVRSVFLPHVDAILMLKVSPKDLWQIHQDVVEKISFIDVENPKFRELSSATYFYAVSFLYDCYLGSV